MKNFLSCDWGTSSFRLRYVDIPSLTFTSIESPEHGIASTFELWRQSGRKEEERFSFYLAVIRNYIGMLEQQLKVSLKNIPLVISGMASSSVGMIDISYKEVPFPADGSDLEVKKINATAGFANDILVISGAKTLDDVLRGEETQLAGCIHHAEEERVFIFPGTHSKHILVKNGRVIDFKTYMTGEFFDILSKKTLLAASVRDGQDFQNIKHLKSFGKGINDSAQSNLLHTAFLVRTNDLLSKLTKEENYYYLSGLLIGTELREITGTIHKKITLVVSEAMKPLYVAALEISGIREGKGDFEIANADTALVKGQIAILDKCKM